MSAFPVIQTAIPHRRYSLGDYLVTWLTDIDSGDGHDYRHIMAFLREGDAKPSLYVCAVRLPPGERQGGGYALRVITRAMSEVMDTADRWGDGESFAAEALQLGQQALGLAQEEAFPLT